MTKNTNDKSCIIDSIKLDNIEITESKQIANECGKFFAIIGYRTSMKGENSKKDISDYLKKKTPNVKPSVFLAPCMVFKINKLIENLPNEMSNGNDDITNVILKQGSQYLASCRAVLCFVKE